MKFYESERIIRKQEKYIISRAYDIIGEFNKSNLSKDEMLACIELTLASNKENDSQRDFLFMAQKILNTQGDSGVRKS